MIHFNDNSIIDDNETNCMFKIQPFVDALKHNFRFTVLPDTCMAVDEQMIPFKGRNGLRQYLTKKPKKRGYKLWALAGVSGCVYNFEVDGSPESKGLPENTNPPSKRGKSDFAVMRLTKGLEKNEHFVFYDNYFSLCTWSEKVFGQFQLLIVNAAVSVFYRLRRNVTSLHEELSLRLLTKKNRK